MWWTTGKWFCDTREGACLSPIQALKVRKHASNRLLTSDFSFKYANYFIAILLLYSHILSYLFQKELLLNFVICMCYNFRISTTHTCFYYAYFQISPYFKLDLYMKICLPKSFIYPVILHYYIYQLRMHSIYLCKTWFRVLWRMERWLVFKQKLFCWYILIILYLMRKCKMHFCHNLFKNTLCSNLHGENISAINQL